jgi:hypothetical protein
VPDTNVPALPVTVTVTPEAACRPRRDRATDLARERLYFGRATSGRFQHGGGPTARGLPPKRDAMATPPTIIGSYGTIDLDDIACDASTPDL